MIQYTGIFHTNTIFGWFVHLLSNDGGWDTKH